MKLALGFHNDIINFELLLNNYKHYSSTTNFRIHFYLLIFNMQAPLIVVE